MSKFKHWKQQQLHQRILKKLKRYPIVPTSLERLKQNNIHGIPRLTETRMVLPETGEIGCQWLTRKVGFSQDFVILTVPTAMTKISIILYS